MIRNIVRNSRQYITSTPRTQIIDDSKEMKTMQGTTTTTTIITIIINLIMI